MSKDRSGSKTNDMNTTNEAGRSPANTGPPRTLIANNVINDKVDDLHLPLDRRPQQSDDDTLQLYSDLAFLFTSRSTHDTSNTKNNGLQPPEPSENETPDQSTLDISAIQDQNESPRPGKWPSCARVLVMKLRYLAIFFLVGGPAVLLMEYRDFAGLDGIALELAEAFILFVSAIVVHWLWRC